MGPAQNVRWSLKIGENEDDGSERQRAATAIAATTKLCDVTHLWCNSIFPLLTVQSAQPPNSIKSERRRLHLCKAWFGAYFLPILPVWTMEPIDSLCPCVYVCKHSQDVSKCPNAFEWHATNLFVCYYCCSNGGYYYQIAMFGQHWDREFSFQHFSNPTNPSPNAYVRWMSVCIYLLHSLCSTHYA